VLMNLRAFNLELFKLNRLGHVLQGHLHWHLRQSRGAARPTTFTVDACGP
jgi:hypothetical protein